MPEGGNKNNDALFDVVVVGAGVVGCAVARRFTLEGARVAIVERATDILAGASKANSAILHTGFDAPPGSLELACMQSGYREYLEIKDRLNLPILETGALVVAWSSNDVAKIDEIDARARLNGVTHIERLDSHRLSEREPHLAPTARAALHIPGEHVIDPWSAPLAYLLQAMENGATAMLSTEIRAGSFDGLVWRLETTHGPISGRVVINCAGLHGDNLEKALLGKSTFEIRPRKGQFVVFDKAAAKLISAIILPVPTERTKGVVLARTVFGNLLVGPTADDQQDRDRVDTDPVALRSLTARAVEMVPLLRDMPVTATYAGLRPATETKEYRVHHDPTHHWITIGGIRSTGLTAALGLARHAYDLYSTQSIHHAPLAAPIWPHIPNLAEHLPRDWQKPAYGEIVCHCEMVTLREIEAAFASKLAPGDLGGLKRRTRAGMGRCQSFYCGARLAELAQDRFAAPLAVDGIRV